MFCFSNGFIRRPIKASCFDPIRFSNATRVTRTRRNCLRDAFVDNYIGAL